MIKPMHCVRSCRRGPLLQTNLQLIIKTNLTSLWHYLFKYSEETLLYGTQIISRLIDELIIYSFLSSLLISIFYTGYPRWTEWGRWLVPCGKSCGLQKQIRRRECLRCTYDRDCDKLPGSSSTSQKKNCPDPCPPKCISKFNFLSTDIIS